MAAIPSLPNTWYKFLIAFAVLVFAISLTKDMKDLPFLRSFSLVTILFGVIFWVIEDWLIRKYSARQYEFTRRLSRVTNDIDNEADAKELNEEYNGYLWGFWVSWVLVLGVIYYLKLFL